MSDEATQDARAILLEGIYADEELRPGLQALIAKKHPNTVAKMPDYAAREAIKAEREEWRKERDADKAEREREKNAGELARRRHDITAGFTGRDGTRVKVSAEDVAAIEKLMIEEGIGSHRAAAELYAAQNRVAAPSAPASRNALVPGRGGAGGDEFKWLEPAFAGDRSTLDRVARDEADKVWADLRAGGARAEHWLSRYGG